MGSEIPVPATAVRVFVFHAEAIMPEVITNPGSPNGNPQAKISSPSRGLFRARWTNLAFVWGSPFAPGPENVLGIFVKGLTVA
jgi:hypothetical protein